MKKTLLFLALVGFLDTGCSKTWSGIKQDTNELLLDTKEAIHEATAPSSYDTSTRINVPKSVSSVTQNGTNDISAPQKPTSTVQIFTDEPTVISSK